MSNPEHLAKLKEGVEAWNEWRRSNRSTKPDLSGANLGGADLDGANLREANLGKADLHEADLSGANLSKADLSGANLRAAHLREANCRLVDLHEADLSEARLYKADLVRANLHEANFSGANLSEANLSEANLNWASLGGAILKDAILAGADLSWANLSGANLSGAFLYSATLVDTNLEDADLTACHAYGISVWNAKLDGAIQSNLIITPPNESVIQVDNLEVAQFIYLLLNNERIRQVIDTITSKVVLILGRFTPARKAVLDAMREELRKRDYLPVLFDFEKPSNQTTVETISTLAHMARFVVADVTDAKSVLQELQAIVPLSPSVVVQPMLLSSQEEPGMFDFLRKFPWVLETYRYSTKQTLLAELDRMVIAPAEAKAKEQTRK